MSRAARDWAWNCQGLTPGQRLVLLALAEHADDAGRCWPSLSRLAERTEVDRRTVTRSLAALETRGLLQRERIERRSTVYTLAVGRSDSNAELQDRASAGHATQPSESQTQPLDRGTTPLVNGIENAPDDRPPEMSGPKPRGKRPPDRGVRPPREGAETPSNVTPLGASCPKSNGFRPLAGGVRPPDLGAPRPPNRHKNRQETVKEPTSTARERPTIALKPARPIPPDWQPGERVFAWAAKQGISPESVNAQIDEFVVYWSDAGERRKSWEATFIHRLQALQARQTQRQDHAPKPRLADKDYARGATPLEKIPWLRSADVA
jgi:DNA-binding transcriptional ArsR family regulator